MEIRSYEEKLKSMEVLQRLAERPFPPSQHFPSIFNSSIFLPFYSDLFYSLFFCRKFLLD